VAVATEEAVAAVKDIAADQEVAADKEVVADKDRSGSGTIAGRTVSVVISVAHASTRQKGTLPKRLMPIKWAVVRTSTAPSTATTAVDSEGQK